MNPQDEQNCPRRSSPALSSAPISVVLFDVGGVLVQLSGIATLLEWVAHRMSPQELWHAWLVSPAVRAFETGRTDADTFATELIRELDLPIDRSRFLESFAGWPTGLYPGALELIARIPSGYTKALLSNSNALHWPRVMNELGLGAAFERQFVSHLIGKIKPDRDAFEHVLDSLQCEPAAVLFLDDNAVNVEAARQAGLRAAIARGIDEAEQVLRDNGVIA